MVLLGFFFQEKKLLTEAEDKIENVFNALKKTQIGQVYCASLDAYAMDYLQSVVELLLLNYQVLIGIYSEIT